MDKLETLILHGPGNPRNSEGCFEKLNDGTLVYAYTRFNGTHWFDESSADICLIRSTDNGRSWSEPELFIKNTAENVMSASFLRLQNGKIAMLYLEKSKIGDTEFLATRPYIAISSDEMKTWSDFVDVGAGMPPFYLCVLNDSLVQLKSGRLICPGSYHRYTKFPFQWKPSFGIFFYSDDNGATWDQAEECCYPPQWSKTGFQEPGVIELEEDHLLAWFRTCDGCQYKSHSYDGGMTWSEAVPATEFKSPESPLSMKRNPANGDLYAVWNDCDPARSVRYVDGIMERTPLVLGISSDNGKSWRHHILEDSPRHGFSYTAMFFNGDELLLAYNCGGVDTCECMLQDLKIRIINWKEL